MASKLVACLAPLRYPLDCLISLFLRQDSCADNTDGTSGRGEQKKYSRVMNEVLYRSSSDNHSAGKNGIDNISFSLADEGDINSLTDDALLVVFSFLSMYDRGRAAKVCKRWRNIMMDSRLWSSINFWQTTQSPAKSNPWANERHVHRLLQTYANSGLRTLHLKVIGTDTLLFLRQHCPNVEVFSFWPPTWPLQLALNSKFRPVPHFSKDLQADLYESLQIPISVVKVQLAFMGVEAPNGGAFIDIECGSFTNALMFRLSRCRNLRHISLTHCDGITRSNVAKLTESLPDLEELWLNNFKYQPSDEEDSAQSILQCVATNLTNLTSFRCITTQLDVDMDEFLITVSKRGKLKHLWLGRGSYSFSEDAFLLFCQNLPGLEELVLESCNSVTDEIVKCIGHNLKKLKLLNLLGGGYYTPENIELLQNHPSLKLTNVKGVHL